MNSMVEVLADYAEKRPDILFCADNQKNEYTYGETWKKVKSAAQALKHNYGIEQNQKILVECNQDADYLIVDFACELIGAVFVPIENNASYDRKRSICEEVEGSLWIYKSGPLDFVKSIHYDVLLEPVEELFEYTFPKETSVAEILYTTGTTGKSKGIVISHRANIAVAENIMYGVEMKAGNVEFIPIPISHSHGIRCCYANLLNGGSIILIDGLMRIKNVFQLLDQYKVTAMDISPSAAALLIKVSKGAFWNYGKKLDYIQIGTASLSENLKEQLVSELEGVRLYNFYGSTESGRSCVLNFSDEKGRINCIGKPTKNAEIVFTDENRNIIKTSSDKLGLLASKGPMNMDCYWNNPELTNEILKDNYIYTSDLGYIDDEGYIYVLGRKGDVINYNGIKIAPEEIEEIANKYSGIRDSACVPMQDAVMGQIPKLYVSLTNPNDEFDTKAFIGFLTEHLDGNKLPKRIEVIDEIPRSFNGKILRKELVI